MSTRRRRGSMMLGMAGFSFVVASAVAIVVIRSVETYRTALTQERSMTLRFAAEGGLSALHAGLPAPAPPLQIGECRLEFTELTDTSATMLVVLDRNGRELETRVYTATKVQDAGWTLHEGTAP